LIVPVNSAEVSAACELDTAKLKSAIRKLKWRKVLCVREYGRIRNTPGKVISSFG
jgi:hypothetical protein